MANVSQSQTDIQALGNLFNAFGGRWNSERAKEFLQREHRTIQQNFVRFAVAYLIELANSNQYDGRNQASWEFAVMIKDIAEKFHFPYI